MCEKYKAPDLSGEILKLLRMINKKSLTEVAGVLGIKVFRYEEYEKGGLPGLTSGQCVALEAFYGMESAGLFGIFKTWELISVRLKTLDATEKLNDYLNEEIYRLKNEMRTALAENTEAEAGKNY